MMRPTRNVILFGAVVALLAGVVGCTAAPDEATEPRVQIDGDEFAKNMQACLSEAGYDVTVYEDGSFGISLPDDQMPAYDGASHECAVRFGYDRTPALTDEQKSDLYDETLALVSCLEEQGYPIVDVPSRQAFIENAEFVPYEQVPPSVVGEEWDKLQRTCPQPR